MHRTDVEQTVDSVDLFVSFCSLNLKFIMINDQ